ANPTCPECGAGLKRAGGVRMGVRRRMVWVMLLGVLLVLLPLAPLFTVFYAAATGTNLAKYTPVGVLLWQTRISSAAVNRQIAAELTDRLLKRQLDKGQSAAVAERVLELQADRSFEWDEAWGDLIERINLNGDLSKEQRQRFEKQAVMLSVRCRGTVRPGDTLPVLVKVDSVRIGSNTQLLCRTSIESAKLGAVALRKAPGGPRSGGMFGSAATGPGGEMMFYLMGSRLNQGWMNSGLAQEQIVQLAVPHTVEPGPQTLSVTLASRCSDFQTGFSGVVKAGDPHAAATPANLPVRVLPKSASPVQRTEPSDALDKALRDLLSQSHVEATVSATSAPLFPIFGGGLSVSRSVTMQLSADTAPTPFAFDVFVRLHGKETKLGQIASARSAAEAGGSYAAQVYAMQSAAGGSTPGAITAFLQAQVPGLSRSDKTVDLIFRPSERAALNTVELSAIYGGEIVLKDFAVTRTGVAPTETGEDGEPATSPKPD
ncbi:MAG TPA: hypothetical protein VEB22_12655, partial [Phycisphaerales bacterium]|nr:hypothetical protein [Phycisphaerales bacterium]